MEDIAAVATSETQQSSPPSCCHYWIIEPPHGLISVGECRYCHTRKEFRNSMRGVDPVRQYKLYESDTAGEPLVFRTLRKPIA